jgi:hypothetical protein
VDIEQRHRHRLLDLNGREEPGERLEQAERERAVAAAMQVLPADVRARLLSRYADDTAHQAPVSPAVTARLARARARFRLEYLLAIRRVELPTPRCHSVLLAIAGHDTRRQQDVHAGQHLLACPTCPQLVDALVTSDLRLFVVAPFVVAAAGLRRLVTAHPAVSAASAVVVGGAAVAAVVVLPGGTTSSPLCRLSGPHADTLVGRRLRLVDVTVAAVPADEAFVLRGCAGRPLWVQLTGRGESPQQVRAGDRATVRGVVRRMTPAELRRLEGSRATATAPAGRRVYLRVPYSALTVRQPSG